MLGKLINSPQGKKSLLIYATVFIVGAVFGYYACVTLSECCPFFGGGGSCKPNNNNNNDNKPHNIAASPAACPTATPSAAPVAVQPQVKLDDAKPAHFAAPIDDTAPSAAVQDDIADDIKVEEVMPEVTADE